MPTKEDEYKAQSYQIVGFALMSPFGRICLQPTVVFNELGPFGFILYLGLSVLAFLVGFIFIDTGRVTLKEKRRLKIEP